MTKKTTRAVDILESMFVDTSAKKKAYQKAIEDAQIAAQIHDLRQQAGLSQAQLAKLIGTTQSVISRLEDADYKGHSLEMLSRIAAALHCRLEVKIIPQKNRAFA